MRRMLIITIDAHMAQGAFAPMRRMRTGGYRGVRARAMHFKPPPDIAAIEQSDSVIENTQGKLRDLKTGNHWKQIEPSRHPVTWKHFPVCPGLSRSIEDERKPPNAIVC